MTSTNTNTSPTVTAILGALGVGKSMSVSDIASAAGISRSTAARNLTTLLEQGAILRDGEAKAAAYIGVKGGAEVAEANATPAAGDKKKAGRELDSVREAIKSHPDVKEADEAAKAAVEEVEKPAKATKAKATANDGYDICREYDRVRLENKKMPEANLVALLTDAVVAELERKPEWVRSGAVELALQKGGSSERFKTVLGDALKRVPHSNKRPDGTSARRGRSEVVKVRHDGKVLVLRVRLPDGWAKAGDLVRITEDGENLRIARA